VLTENGKTGRRPPIPGPPPQSPQSFHDAQVIADRALAVARSSYPAHGPQHSHRDPRLC
jgi:hypothetical protein